MADILNWQSATPMPSYAKRQKDPDGWEKRQRMQEYRVAARRERRNRKADEKKQRKLNATILRRMVRNPEKYSKNTERNKIRDVELERRNIWNAAVRQAQELALKHDTSGATFNVQPVVERESDGAVVDAATQKTAVEQDLEAAQRAVPNIDLFKSPDGRPLSRSQQRKMMEAAPRPAPPKPLMPEGYSVKEGEENFLEMWDLTNDELWTRLQSIKRQKYEARRNLRQKQKAGKPERRAARDEKRRVYRDLKQTWRVIKEQQTKNRKKLKTLTETASREIEKELTDARRAACMEICAELGFTLENTEGVDAVAIRLAGEAKNVNLDEYIVNEDGSEIVHKRQTTEYRNPNKRVDLSMAASKETYLGPGGKGASGVHDDPGDFIQLDTGPGAQFEVTPLNGRVRRIIRSAIHRQRVERELLVRERAKQHYEANDLPIPAVLLTPAEPAGTVYFRQLENGRLETAKQVRVRGRLELAEYNNHARVLRQQAKARAIEAGLRVYAERTGMIPARSAEERAKDDWGPLWYVAPPPDPKEFVRPQDVKLRPWVDPGT